MWLLISCGQFPASRSYRLRHDMRVNVFVGHKHKHTRSAIDEPAFFTGGIFSAAIMNHRTKLNLDATIEVGPGTPDKMVSGLSIILAGYVSGKL